MDENKIKSLERKKKRAKIVEKFKEDNDEKHILNSIQAYQEDIDQLTDELDSYNLLNNSDVMREFKQKLKSDMAELKNSDIVYYDPWYGNDYGTLEEYVESCKLNSGLDEKIPIGYFVDKMVKAVNETMDSIFTEYVETVLSDLCDEMKDKPTTQKLKTEFINNGIITGANLDCDSFNIDEETARKIIIEDIEGKLSYMKNWLDPEERKADIHDKQKYMGIEEKKLASIKETEKENKKSIAKFMEEDIPKR